MAVKPGTMPRRTWLGLGLGLGLGFGLGLGLGLGFGSARHDAEAHRELWVGLDGHVHPHVAEREGHRAQREGHLRELALRLELALPRDMDVPETHPEKEETDAEVLEHA
eukprot:scaffold130592_cov45-Phaeocystis_antarctica.AAC.1